MSKKFYITTPIYYVNDIPHIGHTCTTVAADILARFHKQKGDEVFFLTGTDEHGQKIAQEAEKDGLTPQEFCDRIAPRFQEAWKNLNIDFDFFIRTTDSRHEKVVTEILQKIFDKGDIYKGKYEGYYCVGCEKFLTETELVDKHCPLHPPEKTVWKSEDNWFFRLSKYVPEIIRLIEDKNTNYIFPEGKRSEILAKLKAGVKDVSFSRDSVKWGIPAPWDTTQTIYVWIDALINYYSATRFLDGKEKFWPADLHLLGKEILWFHTVIWQAMLLSAGIEIPRKTYTHSFYIIDGQKMSKSLGNVISPQQLLELFGIDGARYLVATSFPSENDADVGIDRFKEKYNADLANNLGNLVSRIAKLGEGLKIGEDKIDFDPDYENYFSVSGPIKDDGKLDFGGAVNYVFDCWINPANELLNREVPWKLEKTDEKRIKVLNEVILFVRLASFHLRPFMPETCEKIDGIFSGTVKSFDKPLFPRIK